MLRLIVKLFLFSFCLAFSGCAQDMSCLSPFLPEQRALPLRDLSELPHAKIPDVPAPATVIDPQPNLKERYLSLDEAIRITLANSTVVRILAGTTATASGRTIYDPAITNTTIDQEKAVFDPVLKVDNTFSQIETPTAILDPLGPKGARLIGGQTEAYNLETGISKKTLTGGTATINFSDTLDRFSPGTFPLNPQNQHATTLKFEQPLLQGAGVAVNMAPIVIARINTERSFFQLKGSMQDSVRGVIEAYWALVFARTDVLTREQQVKQSEEAFKLAEAQSEVQLKSKADAAQTKSVYANFKAILVGAEANVIQREAALRNIMGLPPADGARLIPTTPPANKRLHVKWDEIVRLAEERRPDLIELKLIIEADQQQYLLANNQALPKINTVALYRWNGLEGTTPSGAHLGTVGNQYTDWVLGVNFSLPLGLRKERAVLRQQELILARDHAYLDQGLHAAVHDLADSTRNVAQFFEQYQAYKEAREAALINLDLQQGKFKAGFTIFLNVQQALTDWGNAVSAEAQALTQFNTELANLERQTGTILETHGIHFFEERFAAIGPLGRLAHPQPYPAKMAPGPNNNIYPNSNEPAEKSFDLIAPGLPKGKMP